MDNAQEFVNAIGLLVSKVNDQRDTDRFKTVVNKESILRLGKIPSDYTTGRPSIIFEGETTASLKQYPYLGSYTPVANDWVLVVKVGNTYVILGKIM